MKRVLNILFVLMLLSGVAEAWAQTTHTVPTSGNQSITTCDAWIYDNGGANGDYSSSCDGYLVVYPSSAGACVCLTGGTYNTESSYDKITIYNGVGTGGAQLEQWSGAGSVSAPIVSTAANGALTIHFHSDVSVTRAGFALHVECVTTETMEEGSLTTCSSIWMDPGGSGNYANNQDVTQAICSDNGDHVVVSFSSFSLSSGDYLYVYDGNDPSATQLGSYTGTTLPPTLVSSGDCLTFRFTSNGSGVNSGWMANISCTDEISYVVPASGNQSVTTCDAWIYDVGGSEANYTNSCNGYLVIYPSVPGSMVSITEGTYHTESIDKITIYNGVGTNGTQLAQWSGTGTVPGPIVSTAANGALTIKFYSDGSVVYEGFALHVECVTTETMEEGSLTTCSSIWTDPGGSGNYANNQDITQTICSDNGDHVVVSFSSFSLSSGDYLYVYDGSDLSAPQLGSYTGTTLPPTLVSSGECLTFRFTSNSSGVNSGWMANISCADEISYVVPASGNQSVTTCDAWIYDIGGPDANYTNSCNGYLVIYPSTPGALVAITGGTYHTESLDKITVYNGVGTSGTQLTQWSGTGTVLSPIVSSAANGALTIKFYSDGSVVYEGFALHVECVTTEMMEEGSLITCSSMWMDPGGSGNYANNQDITQTICSDDNEHLTVSFSSFSLSSGDYLYVYDGESTSAPLLGSYTGSTLPPYVLSSGGCLTFRFTSNSSGTNSGWVANIDCVTCTPQSTGQGSPCAFDNIHPFCTDEGQYTYPSGTEADGDTHLFFGTEDDYSYIGCLYLTPAPAWYFMRIDQPGDLTIHIVQQSLTGGGLDVDFACWGPFTASSTSAFVDNLCCGYYSLNIDQHDNNTYDNGYPYGNLVDCSYSTAAVEDCHIHNAHTGEYYLLVITNYSRRPGTITFNSTNQSTATTDCSIMAQVANTGPYCEGDTIHLICNNPQAGATYSWTGPGGWTSSEVNPIIYPATMDMDGNEYSLVKTVDGSSSEPATTAINMMSLNTVITLSPSDTICPGQQITLSTTSDIESSVPVSGTCSNLWLPTNTHAARVTVRPSETTTYVLQQTFGNCVGLDSVTVVVSTPYAQIDASDTVICRGDTVTLSSECPAESGTCVWQWLPGQLSDASVQVTPEVTTSYILRQTINGCEAADTIQIHVNQPFVNTDTIFRIVARDSLPYVFLGQSYPDVGAYDIHLSTIHGCDSLITLVLLYPDTIWASADSVVCPDQFPLVWNGVTFHQDSTAEAFFIAHNGADSVLQMTVQHYSTPIQSLNMVAETCAGDALPVSIGMSQNSSLLLRLNPIVASKELVGPWVTRLTDSTFTITPPYDLSADTTVDYQFVLQIDAGCVYDTTTQVTFHRNYALSLDTTICDTELPFTWEGMTFTAATNQVLNLQTASGCDSLITLVVNVNPTYLFVDAIEVCDSFVWKDSVTYTESTNAPMITYTTVSGCDSIWKLNLTVHNSVETEVVVSECDSFVWIDGNTYYESTQEPLMMLQTAAGCDSIVHLNLTLGHSAASDTTAEVCGIFSWYEHKNIRNSCDNLTHTFATQDGCDSVVTLHLTVHPLPVACFNYFTLGDSYEIEIPLHFEECTPGMENYHWDMGNSDEFEGHAFDYTYFQAGSYRVSLTVTDENGCTAEKHRVVVIKTPEMQIYIPNSFTPNHDGTNDVFKPMGMYITDDHYLFVIYDRWGEIVFRTTNPDEGWDGKYKGAIVPNGSVMNYTLQCVSEKGMVKRKGAVVVVY